MYSTDGHDKLANEHMLYQNTHMMTQDSLGTKMFKMEARMDYQ